MSKSARERVRERLAGKTWQDSGAVLEGIKTLRALEANNVEKWRKHGISGWTGDPVGAAIASGFRTLGYTEDWDPPIEAWCLEEIPGYADAVEEVFLAVEKAIEHVDT